MEKISQYDRAKIRKLLSNPGIVRNRLKIESAISNAKAYLAIREEFGSFDRYIWQFVSHRPKQNRWRTLKQIGIKKSFKDKKENALELAVCGKYARTVGTSTLSFKRIIARHVKRAGSSRNAPQGALS